VRLERLVADYGENQIKGLEEAITNIKRRLGNEQWKNAIEALHAKDFAQVAAITLYYYDKAYDKGLSMKETKELFRFSFDEGNTEDIAKVLIAEANKKYGN
jgi:tRNA 2-selenouridine synthase